MKDRVLRLATERAFQIVGEALLRVRKVDPQLASRVPDFDKIVGFRNVLVHGYDEIDDSVVWLTVQEDLPKLATKLTELLDESS